MSGGMPLRHHLETRRKIFLLGLLSELAASELYASSDHRRGSRSRILRRSRGASWPPRGEVDGADAALLPAVRARVLCCSTTLHLRIFGSMSLRMPRSRQHVRRYLSDVSRGRPPCRAPFVANVAHERVCVLVRRRRSLGKRPLFAAERAARTGVMRTSFRRASTAPPTGVW